MAESLKFEGLNGALEVYPDLPWKASGSSVSIYDEKQGKFVRVHEGDYIVSVGDRYEVTDKKPKEAKKATAPKETKKEEPVKDKNDITPTPENERDTSVATEVVRPADDNQE